MRTSRLPALATGQHGLQQGALKLIVVVPWVRWPSHIVAKPPLRVPLLSVFPGGLAQTSGLIVCGGSLAFTPKVRSLDGVVCVLLCVGLCPCRLHVVLHKTSKLPDLQKRCYLSHEGGDSINCSIAPLMYHTTEDWHQAGT